MPDRKMQKRRGGLVLVDALIAQGIDHAFVVPGESYLEVLDGLHERRGTITTTTCRFEAGAVHMAEAYGKLTGKCAVAMVTRGPGACHAAIGVHVAQQDSTPLLLIVGQIPFAETDRESFQEIDYRRFFGPIAKFVTQIDEAARIPELIAHAVDVATSGRPGPVVVAISEEMQAHVVEVRDRRPIARFAAPPPAPAMRALAERLARARQPVAILGGSGWTPGGLSDIRQFLARLDIPVAAAFRRLAVYDGTAPNYIGDLSVGADPGLVAHVREADLILAIGTRIGEPVSQGYTLFPDPASVPLIHVYPEASEIGRVYRPLLGIACDVNEFAHAAAALPPVEPHWHDWTRMLRATREAYTAARDYPGGLNVSRVMKVLQTMLPRDAILTTDAGNFAAFVTRFLNVRAGQDYLGPTNGAMGYGVPAAVGAAIAFPGRQVVCFVGDGGFMMTGQELATAVMCHASPIILLFNNGMYGTIRMHQETHFPGRVMASRLSNPDFVAYAQSFGANAFLVEEESQFADAFAAALDSSRPSVIELRTDPAQISPRMRLAEAAGKGLVPS